MTTVVVVDDQALIRTAVRDLLDAAEGISVVGEAVDGEAGVELVRGSPHSSAPTPRSPRPGC